MTLPSIPREPKPPGIKMPSTLTQDALGALPLDFFGFNPGDVHAGFMVDAAVHQRFGQTLVAFLQAGIFPHQARSKPHAWDA